MSFELVKGLRIESEEDAKPHIKGLEDCSNCRHISLSGNSLGVGASKAIAKAIGKHKDLEVANLDDIFTGRLKEEIPPALEAFGEALADKEKLITIDYSDNAFGPPGVRAFLPLVTKNHAIRNLRVNNVGLTNRGGSLVARALLGMPSPTDDELESDVTLEKADAGEPSKYCKITQIIAGRNRLEDLGAVALGKAFGHLKSLQSVRIPQNGINPRGSIAIAAGLAENKGLTELDLYDNNVNVEGAKAIAKAIPNFTALKILNIGDCLLEDGLSDLFEALHTQPSLEELNLEYNEIADERVEALIKLVKKLPNLKKLDVNGNCFTAAQVAQVKKIFAGHGNPDALGDMDENDIDLEEEEDDGEDGANQLSQDMASLEIKD